MIEEPGGEARLNDAQKYNNNNKCNVFSFRGTAIKPDMSNNFASLLCACPQIKNLKYVKSINICFNNSV